MRATYDRTANAAYVYLTEGRQPSAATFEVRGAKMTRKGRKCLEINGINLDFDADGVLLGIEVLGAKSRLPPELLAAAEDITAEIEEGA